MKNVSLSEFKAWSKRNSSVAEAVCMAMAFAELERERVDAYILPLFKSYGFKKGRDGLPIDSPAHLYLCEDEALVAEYYEDCDKAHREHGFKGPKGHCPALSAEYLLTQAENALIKSGCDLLGVDPDLLWGENRARMLDLLLGACLKKEAA